MPATKFAALDGLRGLAAIVVMTRHTSQFWGFHLPHSYLAVDVFFLLSGFVIAHSYEAKLASGRLSAVGFMGLRLLRLYPVYLLALLLEAAYRGAGFAAVARGALFIPSFGTDLFPLVGPAWSLVFELIVNVIYVVARPWLTTRRLLAVAAVMFVAMCGAAARNGDINVGWFGSPLGFLGGLARATFGMFLGVALFRSRAALSARVPRGLGSALAVGAVVAILCARAPGPAWLYDILAVTTFPLFVLAAAREEPPLSSLMFILGSVSYPMYLLHGISHVVIQEHFDVARWAPVSGIVFAVVLSAICVAIERYYDLPLRRFVKARVDAMFARKSAEPSR